MTAPAQPVPAPPPSAPVPTDAPVPTPDKGFPAETPVAEMTVVQQAAYWKFQARKHEQTARDRGDYDDLKAKAAEADRLRQERETEAEKQVREAREQARAEALRESAPRLVAAEFRAALSGRLSDDQRDALIEDINPDRYLNADGTVDIAKVRERADKIAPVSRAPRPDHSQGGRESSQRGSQSVAQVMADRAAARQAKQKT